MRLTNRGRAVVAGILTILCYLALTVPPLWWVR